MWEYHLFYLCSGYSGDTEFARVHRMIDHVETWICNLTRLDEPCIRDGMQRCLKENFLSIKQNLLEIHSFKSKLWPIFSFLCHSIYTRELGDSPFFRRLQKHLRPVAHLSSMYSSTATAVTSPDCHECLQQWVQEIRLWLSDISLTGTCTHWYVYVYLLCRDV